MKTKPKEISLEEYLRLLHSDPPREVDYTINQLNEIISMHGFKKIASKKKLTDAVKTMDLIDPARSTLKENVSSRAILELYEVVADLSAIKWQECCITSIQTLSKEDPQGDDKTSSPKHTTNVANPKSHTKAPIKEDELGDDPNATTAVGGSPSGSRTIDAPPPSKKRVKKMDAPPSSKKGVKRKQQKKLHTPGNFKSSE